MGAMSSPYGQDPYGNDQSGGGQPYGNQSPYGQPGYGDQSSPGNPYGGQPSPGSPYGGQPSPGPYGDPGGYGAPGYGYQTQGYGAPGGYQPQEHPQGTTIMVLGIISLFTCFILGIIALVMGKKALGEIDSNPGAYTNRGNVKAGVICGLISVILQGIGVVIYIIAIIAVAVSAGSM